MINLGLFKKYCHFVNNLKKSDFFNKEQDYDKLFESILC